MELYMNGVIFFPKKDTDKVLEILDGYELLPDDVDDCLAADDYGSAAIEYRDVCLGDIDDDLTEALQRLKNNNIPIKGALDYYGDYDGRYVIENYECKNLDAQAVVIKDASDDDLIFELEARGYRVTEIAEDDGE